jgi:hypothetical protein
MVLREERRGWPEQKEEGEKMKDYRERIRNKGVFKV